MSTIYFQRAADDKPDHTIMDVPRGGKTLADMVQERIVPGSTVMTDGHTGCRYVVLNPRDDLSNGLSKNDTWPRLSKNDTWPRLSKNDTWSGNVGHREIVLWSGNGGDLGGVEMEVGNHGFHSVGSGERPPSLRNTQRVRRRTGRIHINF